MKFVYAFFLGIILALFVGMGISTFYTEPKMPEYPHSITAPELTVPEGKVPAEDIQAQREYEEAYKKYNQESQVYHRNVSIISLIAAVLFVIVGLFFERRNSVIMNGVMMGGVFTLLYSIGRGIASTDTKYTFIAVSVSLAVVLFLGYRKFNDAAALSTKKPAKKRK